MADITALDSLDVEMDVVNYTGPSTCMRYVMHAREEFLALSERKNRDSVLLGALKVIRKKLNIRKRNYHMANTPSKYSII